MLNALPLPLCNAYRTPAGFKMTEQSVLIKTETNATLIQGCKWASDGSLLRRLAGRHTATTVLTSILAADTQAANTGRQKRERVVLVVVGVEVVAGTSRRGAIAGRLESCLSRAAVESPSRVRARSRPAEVSVKGRRVRGSTSAEPRGKGISAGGPTEVLGRVWAGRGEGRRRRGKRSRAGRTSHGSLTHVVLEARSRLHLRSRITRVGNHRGTGTASAAAQAAHVLGKVVIATSFVAALPVTSAERNNATATHTAVTTTSMSVMATAAATHVVGLGRRDHRRTAVSIAAAVAHVAGRSSSNSREGAAEARSTALEVGETTRWAGPVTGTRPVLAGRERREDLGSPIQDTARRRRNLNGLLVQSPAVHAQALGSLGKEEKQVSSMVRRGKDTEKTRLS